jgi:hypothetical protein
VVSVPVRADVDSGSRLRLFLHLAKQRQSEHLRPARKHGQPRRPFRPDEEQDANRLQSQHVVRFVFRCFFLSGPAATVSSVGLLHGLVPRVVLVLVGTRDVAVRRWPSRSELSERTTMSCDAAESLPTIKSALSTLPSPAPSLDDGLALVMSRVGCVVLCLSQCSYRYCTGTYSGAFSRECCFSFYYLSQVGPLFCEHEPFSPPAAGLHYSTYNNCMNNCY